MIIQKKIRKLYSEKELKEKLGTYQYYYNFSKEVKNLDKISKVFPVKEFYFFKDFLKDFSVKYEKYTELETIYKILINGINIYKFINLNKNIKSQLYSGFIMESIAFSKEQIPYIVINYDIVDFQISVFDNHIELFGSKEKLEEFKEKFNISQKILMDPFINSWHLAFSGLLSEKIKYDLKNKKE